MPDDIVLEMKDFEIQFPGVKALEALESGETFDKEIIHPEEGVYDCVGGIEVEGTTSVLAADVIDERLY